MINFIPSLFTDNPLVQRILSILQSLSSNTLIIIIWVPEHINFPEQAVKKATSFANTTDNSLISASNIKNHFRSLILQSWNLHWKNQLANKLFTTKQIHSSWS